MNNNRIVLESLAMDLKRVAIGYHRNSFSMATRFYEEALKRKSEVEMKSVKPYLRDILEKIDSLQSGSPDIIADRALLFSTLLQNYIQRFL